MFLERFPAIITWPIFNEFGTKNTSEKYKCCNVYFIEYSSKSCRIEATGLWEMFINAVASHASQTQETQTAQSLFDLKCQRSESNTTKQLYSTKLYALLNHSSVLFNISLCSQSIHWGNFWKFLT